jgi:hypothetical protein
MGWGVKHGITRKTVALEKTKVNYQENIFAACLFHVYSDSAHCILAQVGHII